MFKGLSALAAIEKHNKSSHDDKGYFRYGTKIDVPCCTSTTPKCVSRWLDYCARLDRRFKTRQTMPST
jgi:hypothetical protein